MATGKRLAPVAFILASSWLAVSCGDKTTSKVGEEEAKRETKRICESWIISDARTDLKMEWTNKETMAVTIKKDDKVVTNVVYKTVLAKTPVAIPASLPLHACAAEKGQLKIDFKLWENVAILDGQQYTVSK